MVQDLGGTANRTICIEYTSGSGERVKMTRSKIVLVERPNIPTVAPGTLILYADNNQLYMKDDNQEVTLLSVSSDIAAIKAVTDNLPNNGALTDISDETDKIDSAATDGLAGTSNSTAYRAHETERHFHSYESWFETAASPSGETNVADRIGDGSGVFQIDAGNNDWGSWVQVLGSADTPARAGNTKFDLHRLEISATERNEVYFVQVAFGDSGAAGLAAGDYTEAVFKAASNQVDSGPVIIQDRRKDVGTKAWARCKCPGQNTATLDFYLGLHEYEG